LAYPSAAAESSGNLEKKRVIKDLRKIKDLKLANLANVNPHGQTAKNLANKKANKMDKGQKTFLRNSWVLVAAQKDGK